MPTPTAPDDFDDFTDNHASGRLVTAKFTQTDELPLIVQAKTLKKHTHVKSHFRWRLWLTTFVTCFLYASPTGFHYVVLNNSKEVVEKFMRENLEEQFQTEFRFSIIWSAVNACMSVGCVFGSFASAYFADRFGRKFTLMCIANVLSIIGNGFLIAAKPTQYVSFLAVGRGICGLAAGFAQPILGVYLMESCPPHLAGFVGSFVDTFLAVMLTVTHLCATPDPLGTDEYWPILLSLTIWLAVAGLILYPVFPETPKYLITTKNDFMKGAKSVMFFHDLRKDEKSEALKIAQGISNDEEQVRGSPIGWIEAWTVHTRPLMISTIVGVAAVFCGHIALQSYSTQILVITGMRLKTAQIETIIMGGFETLGGLMAPIVNHYGTRRFVLLNTLMVCVLGNLSLFGLIFAAGFVNDQRLMYATTSVAMVLVFAAITGPFALRPIVASEVAPQAVRAKAVTLTMGASQSMAIFVQWMSWPFFKMYGPYLFLSFAGMTFFTWVYIFAALPDNPKKVASPASLPHEDVKYHRLLDDASETSDEEVDELML